MALGPNIIIRPRPFTPSVYGKAINFVPGDPTLQVEIERATDLAGTGATTIATGLLFPKPGAPYVDQRVNDGSSWFYRARHNSPGGDPGPWTNPRVGGVVKVIPPDVLAASVNYGGGSVYPIVRALPMDDTLYALRATETDGSTKSSSAHNPQVSIIPVPTSKAVKYTSKGGTSGHMWIAIDFTVGSFVTVRADGSTFTVTVPASASQPAAPTIGNVAGGALALRSRFVRVAYAKRGHNTVTPALYTMHRTSPESGGANNIPANTLLKVTSPAAVAGYDGYVVLVGSASAAEVVQQQFYIDDVIPFGTDWTEPAGGAQTSSTVRTPWDAAMNTAVTVGELLASTGYLIYLYYDPTTDLPATGAVRIGCSAPDGVPLSSAGGDVVAAAEQNGDGHFPFGFGPLDVITTPVAGGSGTTSNINSKAKYL